MKSRTLRSMPDAKEMLFKAGTTLGLATALTLLVQSAVLPVQAKHSADKAQLLAQKADEADDEKSDEKKSGKSKKEEKKAKKESDKAKKADEKSASKGKDESSDKNDKKAKAKDKDEKVESKSKGKDEKADAKAKGKDEKSEGKKEASDDKSKDKKADAKEDDKKAAKKKKGGWFGRGKDNSDEVVEEEVVEVKEVEKAPETKPAAPVKAPVAVTKAKEVSSDTTDDKAPVLLPDTALISVLQDINKSLTDINETSGVETEDDKLIVRLAKQILDKALGGKDLNRILAPEFNSSAKTSMTTEAWASGDIQVSDKLRGSIATVWGKRINGLLNVTIAGDCQDKTLSTGEKVGEFIVVVQGRSPVKSGFDIQSQSDVTYWIGTVNGVSIDAACQRLKEKPSEGEENKDAAAPEKSGQNKSDDVKKKSLVVLETILTRRGRDYLSVLQKYQEQQQTLLAQRQADAALAEEEEEITADDAKGPVKVAGRQHRDDDGADDERDVRKRTDDSVADERDDTTDSRRDRRNDSGTGNRRNDNDDRGSDNRTSDNRGSNNRRADSNRDDDRVQTTNKSSDNKRLNNSRDTDDRESDTDSRRSDTKRANNSRDNTDNRGDDTDNRRSGTKRADSKRDDYDDRGGQTANRRSDDRRADNSGDDSGDRGTDAVDRRSDNRRADNRDDSNDRKASSSNNRSDNNDKPSDSRRSNYDDRTAENKGSNRDANDSGSGRTDGRRAYGSDDRYTSAPRDTQQNNDRRWDNDEKRADIHRPNTDHLSDKPKADKQLFTPRNDTNTIDLPRISMMAPGPASASSNHEWESPAVSAISRQPSLGASLVMPDRAIAGRFLTVSVIGKDKQPERSVELSFNGATLSTDPQGQALFMVPDDATPGHSLHVSLSARPELSPGVIDILQPLFESNDQKTPQIDKVSRMVSADGVLIVDGHDFDGMANRNRIIIDGEQDAAVIAASPVQLRVSLPKNMTVGTHTVNINSTTVSNSDLRSNPARFDYIRASIEQPDLRKTKGVLNKIVVRVNGTKSPVSVRIVNRTPEVIRFSRGDNLLVTTSGGIDNSYTVGLKQLKKGDYKVETTIEM